MWAGVLRVNVSGGPSSKTRDGAGGVGAGGGGRGQAADFYHIMDQSDVTDHRPQERGPGKGGHVLGLRFALSQLSGRPTAQAK